MEEDGRFFDRVATIRDNDKNGPYVFPKTTTNRLQLLMCKRRFLKFYQPLLSHHKHTHSPVPQLQFLIVWRTDFKRTRYLLEEKTVFFCLVNMFYRSHGHRAIGPGAHAMNKIFFESKKGRGEKIVA